MHQKTGTFLNVKVIDLVKDGLSGERKHNRKRVGYIPPEGEVCNAYHYENVQKCVVLCNVTCTKCIVLCNVICTKMDAWRSVINILFFKVHEKVHKGGGGKRISLQ